MRFITLRLLQAIPVILVVITVTFFLVRIAPGGPFDSEKAVTREVKAALEAQYKLNLPLFQQFTAYLGDLAQGDLDAAQRALEDAAILSDNPIASELGLARIEVRRGLHDAAKERLQVMIGEELSDRQRTQLFAGMAEIGLMPRIPEEFPLPAGKLTCVSAPDLICEGK